MIGAIVAGLAATTQPNSKIRMVDQFYSSYFSQKVDSKWRKLVHGDVTLKSQVDYDWRQDTGIDSLVLLKKNINAKCRFISTIDELDLIVSTDIKCVNDHSKRHTVQILINDGKIQNIDYVFWKNYRPLVNPTPMPVSLEVAD